MSHTTPSPHHLHLWDAFLISLLPCYAIFLPFVLLIFFPWAWWFFIIAWASSGAWLLVRGLRRQLLPSLQIGSGCVLIAFVLVPAIIQEPLPTTAGPIVVLVVPIISRVFARAIAHIQQWPEPKRG